LGVQFDLSFLLNAVYKFSHFIKLTGKLFKRKIIMANKERVSITKLHD